MLNSTEELIDTLCTKFNICGCGDPDKALSLILEVLTLIYQRSTIETITYEEYNDKLNSLLTDERVRYCMLYFIDSSGVIEHGGSVGGSWIDEMDWYRKLQQYFDYPEKCNHCFDSNKNIADGCCIHCEYHEQYLIDIGIIDVKNI